MNIFYQLFKTSENYVENYWILVNRFSINVHFFFFFWNKELTRYVSSFPIIFLFRSLLSIGLINSHSPEYILYALKRFFIVLEPSYTFQSSKKKKNTPIVPLLRFTGSCLFIVYKISCAFISISNDSVGCYYPCCGILANDQKDFGCSREICYDCAWPTIVGVENSTSFTTIVVENWIFFFTKLNRFRIDLSRIGLKKRRVNVDMLRWFSK